MIPWQTIVDPEFGAREYKAHVADIDFYIWHEIGPQPFGISAHRRLPDGTNEPLTHSGYMIEWCDTVNACKARAEDILHDHKVR